MYASNGVALVPGRYWAKRCSLGYASRSQGSSLMILSLEIGFISGGTSRRNQREDFALRHGRLHSR